MALALAGWVVVDTQGRRQLIDVERGRTVAEQKAAAAHGRWHEVWEHTPDDRPDEGDCDDG